MKINVVKKLKILDSVVGRGSMLMATQLYVIDIWKYLH